MAPTAANTPREWARSAVVPTPKLGLLDRYLTLWILAAMALGLALGVWAPGVGMAVEQLQTGGTNWLITAGLMLMLFPPLAKVKYEALPQVLADRKVLGLTLLLNWVIGPVLMFGLAVVFLADYPGYFTGLVLIGLARCIAMVIIWNELARGNTEYAAGLVAFNSLFQLVLYSPLAWLFLDVVAPALGLKAYQAEVPFGLVAQSVALYLGVPFALGYGVRAWLVRQKGEAWYQYTFLPRIAPISLVALLATIVLLFSLKGDTLVALPLDVVRVAVPLTLYFVLMFLVSFGVAKLRGADYRKTATLSFTAASNNFELAIAVAIALYGLHSPAAFAAVIGPLIEVPVMLGLVRVSLALQQKFYPTATA
ncbi:MAG: ACR3 family arsenite efflux transporter [Bacteroidia bacterium]|nr:ACR3 family arsenite efflux transporter [Bacteroidia bacterium]